MIKTILVLQSSYGIHTELEIEGVSRYARTVGWNVQIVECGRAAMNLFAKPTAGIIPKVDELLSLWHPRGLIVSPDVSSYVLKHPVLSGLPTVFWDCDPELLPEGASYVCSDSRQVACVAASELLRLGYPNFAYVAFDRRFPWSSKRGIEFCHRMCEYGYEVTTFDGKVNPNSSTVHLRAMESFVRSLPRPCAIFAANDIVAERVAIACRNLRIDVPGDVAILGVDDDRSRCETSRPTLSSIKSNYEQGGYLAAEALAELMGRSRHRSVSREFGTLGVVRRMSTRKFLKMDARVSAAMEFIRLHACEGIGVDDVVDRLDCGRRMAELLFRSVQGKTILECIHENRIEQVKQMLLQPSQKLSVISDVCGYSSVVDMRRVFKRMVGMSPQAWRESRLV